MRSDAWHLLADPAERAAFPLWPARAYAELYAIGDWAAAVATPIELDDLESVLLPDLERTGIGVAVFPVRGAGGCVVEPGFLTAALREESRKYE